MSDQENLSSVGQANLKDILRVRYLLDYRAFLEKDDQSPLDQETIRNITDPGRGKGWAFAIGTLINRFNESPADAAAAARLFGLELDPDNPKLKAYQFSAAVLDDLGGDADLKKALARLDGPAGKAISAKGRALLRQVLYLRDFLDYFKYLLLGDKPRGLASPLSGELLEGSRDLKKWPEVFGRLVERFNSNPADVKLAVKLFGLRVKPGLPVKARDFALSGEVFRLNEHSAALRQLLCKVDKAECPAAPAPTPAPVIPATAPKPRMIPTEPPPAVMVPTPPPVPAEPKPVVTSAANQKQLALVRQSLLNGDLPAAVKARKKIAPAGLSVTDEQFAKDFDSGLAWLSRAAEQAKKGNNAAARSSYMAAKLMLPAEAAGLIDKKLAELEKLGAPAGAAPIIRPTLERLPEARPETVARYLQMELRGKFAQRAQDPRVKNFGATKLAVKITAAPDPDGAAVTFTATLLVQSYESDILKVITPCTVKYTLPPGYTAAKLDAFMSQVQKQADTNTFTITRASAD